MLIGTPASDPKKPKPKTLHMVPFRFLHTWYPSGFFGASFNRGTDTILYTPRCPLAGVIIHWERDGWPTGPCHFTSAKQQPPFRGSYGSFPRPANTILLYLVNMERGLHHFFLVPPVQAEMRELCHEPFLHVSQTMTPSAPRQENRACHGPTPVCARNMFSTVPLRESAGQ